MSLSIITFDFKFFLNRSENPPVIIILKDFLVSFLINSIILFLLFLNSYGELELLYLLMY